MSPRSSVPGPFGVSSVRSLLAPFGERQVQMISLSRHEVREHELPLRIGLDRPAEVVAERTGAGLAIIDPDAVGELSLPEWLAVRSP